MTRMKTLTLGLILVAGLGSAGFGSSLSGSSAFYTDAYLNMGEGDYADASSLTSGGAKPWYQSPVVRKVYGGTPSHSQREDFVEDVFVRTRETFQKSGLSLSLTDNPNDEAPRTLSVVSGTNNPSNPNAIGISYIGGNGFSFIDGLKYANTVDELKWAVAHNVSHELMHAFGGGHHDSTGQYLDSARTDWETLIDPNARFSTDAVNELRSKDFRAPQGFYYTNWYLFGTPWGRQEILARGLDSDTAPDFSSMTLMAAPVPEPATLAIWGLIGLGGCLLRSARKRRSA